MIPGFLPLATRWIVFAVLETWHRTRSWEESLILSEILETERLKCVISGCVI